MLSLPVQLRCPASLNASSDKPEEGHERPSSLHQLRGSKITAGWSPYWLLLAGAFATIACAGLARLGEVLEVVGAKPIPRTEVTKRLWAYIKKNGLQDAKNRRMIKADAALKPVFGGKAQVNMFEMTRLVNKHVSQ